MMRLTDEQIAQYFHRSYTSVDGLWFMKVEELRGFEEALELDRQVWEIFPKIQARTLMAMMNPPEKGLAGLQECLTTKLDLENFQFQAQRDERGNGDLLITITRCPWHDLLIKAGREELSERIGTTICNAEYRTWASEFGDHISFRLESQICRGDSTCVLRFSESR
jgi:hypothetical protein